jgi:hypothetical protein
MATLKNTTINDTGFFLPASGTTAERPVSATVGMMRYNSTTNYLEFYDGVAWVNIAGRGTIPVTSGLVGWYLPDNYSNGTWTDASGSGNNAMVTRGVISKSTQDGTSFGANATFTTLSGARDSGIQFPVAILPATFSLFHVSRYNFAIGTTGGNDVGRARIFDGVTANWLSGFWNGGSGRCYHDGWLTSDTIDYHGNYWVANTDQNSRYRSKSKNANSGNWYNFTGGGGTSKQLSINYGSYTTGSSGETSIWMVAEVVVYNRTLSDAEITLVENYLTTKYGI